MIAPLNVLFVSYIICILISFVYMEIRVTDPDPTVPNVSPTATKGMIIDAGSGGSRLHIFSWKARIFDTVPPPLSYPEANEQWNARIDPGIHNFANNPQAIYDHLASLIDFARVALVGKEKEFSSYPIYFKATGGMREIELNSRELIINEVRRLLSDKSFCPFFFRPDFARVISGEEEAVFSWAATNFLMGTLLPNSLGIGEVQHVNSTFGTLDLGGASTQIAFFVPSQDISEGLFKLQLGGQKQWNVYTKSFLQFGINSARERHLVSVADDYIRNNKGNLIASGKITTINNCFHSGYSEFVKDSSGLYTVEITGPSNPDPNQLKLCHESIKPLMEKEAGKFCDQVYHGDCSIAGAYQPPLPRGQHGHFIGQSSYKIPWNFLMLPKTATLDLFEEKATNICKMSFGEIMIYYESHGLNDNNEKLSDYLPYYCFLSSYVISLLEDGYSFQKDQTLTVIDQVNGHKVGWALGAILYEINELPWILSLSQVDKHPIGFAFMAAVLGFFMGVLAAWFVYREVIEDKTTKATSDPFDDIKRVDTIDFIRKQQDYYQKSPDFFASLEMPVTVSGTDLEEDELSKQEAARGNDDDDSHNSSEASDDDDSPLHNNHRHHHKKFSFGTTGRTQGGHSYQAI